MYRKLQPKSTLRLIQVQPTLDDRIVCHIHAKDPEATPDLKYYALSYKWGDATSKRMIYLKDSVTGHVEIRQLHENLWQFLREVKEQNVAKPELAERFIWTDFLCLNQNDTEEKNEQVPRMGEIYSKAAGVMIWLGNDDYTQAKLKDLRDPPTNETNVEKLLIRGLHWSSIDLITSRDYWRRVWVIQEIALASKACVMAGNVSMDLADLEAKLNLYEAELKRDSNGQIRSTIRDTGPMRLFELRAWLQGSQQGMPLWKAIEMVYKYDDTGCSRRQDAVYGLLGLIEGYKDGHSPTSQRLGVDYDKTGEDVLFDTLFEAWPPVKLSWGFLKYIYGALHPNLWDRGSAYSHASYPSLGSKPVQAAQPLALEQYLTADKTTPEHEDFARLALKVFKSMVIVAYTIGYGRWFFAARYLLESQVPDDESQVMLTPSQRAALVGFALAMEASDQSQPSFGPQCPAQNLDAPTPWHCKCAPTRDTNVSQAEGSSQEWGTCFRIDDEKHVRWICGNYTHRDFCDGSEASFEMPEIGFRLVITKLVPGERQPYPVARQTDGYDDPSVEKCIAAMRLCFDTPATLSKQGVDPKEGEASG